MLWMMITGWALALQQAPAPQITPATPPKSDDIVVTGMKDLSSPDSAVTHATLGSNRTGTGAIASRTVYAQSARFADCAVNGKPRLDLLRQALDGRINGARQAYAQSRLVQINIACTQAPQLTMSVPDNRAVASNYTPGYDTTYYDRGALFLSALKTYAPELALTASETADPAVQARFNAREESLATFRLPVDRHYFEVAVCLVRLQPALAVRLVRTSSPREIAPLEAAIVNRARVCVGGAKKVYFDPSQFRLYIADAVYRWVVAARGVDSLIPRADPAS